MAVFPGGEWMVPGRAARSADAGPVFGKAPGPRQSTPSPATPPGTPSSAPASSTPSAPLRGHERPRQDHGPGTMDRGTAAFRQALQLAGAWRLTGTCGQGLHRGAAAGEAASSPCTAGESAGTGRTGNRNPDRATPTARRTYPSAEPKPRGGLTRGGPRLTIRRLGTTLRPPPISQLNSRIAPARGKKRFSVSKIMMTIRLFTP